MIAFLLFCILIAIAAPKLGKTLVIAALGIMAVMIWTFVLLSIFPNV